MFDPGLLLDQMLAVAALQCGERIGNRADPTGMRVRDMQIVSKFVTLPR